MLSSGFISLKAVEWNDFGLIAADELLFPYQANLV